MTTQTSGGEHGRLGVRARRRSRVVRRRAHAALSARPRHDCVRAPQHDSDCPANVPARLQSIRGGRAGRTCRPANRSSWCAITRATSTRSACSRACRCGACTTPFPLPRPTISFPVRSAASSPSSSSTGCRSIATTTAAPASTCAVELLAGPDNVLIMFPEGTRSRSGALGRFRSGVARLVAGTSTPVVPCHLSGAYEAWPKGRLVPRPGRSPAPHRPASCLPGRVAVDPEAVAAISAQLRDDVAALAPGASMRATTSAKSQLLTVPSSTVGSQFIIAMT